MFTFSSRPATLSPAVAAPLTVGALAALLVLVAVVREAKAGVLVATGGTAASVVVDAVEASPRVVVVVVAVGSEV